MIAIILCVCPDGNKHELEMDYHQEAVEYALLALAAIGWHVLETQRKEV